MNDGLDPGHKLAQLAPRRSIQNVMLTMRELVSEVFRLPETIPALDLGAQTELICRVLMNHQQFGFVAELQAIDYV